MIGDRYELDRQIRRDGEAGDTATVWVGHDVLLGGDVEMKRLEAGADELVEQAQLSSRVRHPNVVAVYDLVDEDEHRWLVMEHVDGATLAELCDGSPLAPRRVAALMTQVADALAAAHANGIVHGGLKPSNVLVTADDVAKLGDFGIARPDDATSRAYRAPELAETDGAGETTAADVWSFGATVYHACTGTPPHDAVALPARHPLAEVVGDAMQRDPSARPTMAHVAQALRDVVETSRSDDGSDDAQPSPGPAVPSATLRRLHPTGAHGTTSGDETLTAAVARLLPGEAPTPAVSPSLRTVTITNAVVLVSLGLVAVLGAVQADATGPTSPRTSAAAAQVERDVPSLASQAPRTLTAETLTDQDVEDFARRYVDTAERDPAAAYATMLTRDRRVLSGPVEEFQPLWAPGVRNVSVRRMAADADALRATFIAGYTTDGTERTATVVLRLALVDGTLLLDAVEAV